MNMNNWLKSMEAALEARGVRKARAAREVQVALEALAAQIAARVAALEAALEKKENNGPGLILPPGTGLRDMLHVIYSPKIAERVFDPTIADMQLEWGEAMIHDRTWLARWIRVRGVLTVLLTVLAQAVTALGSIFKLVK